MSNRPAHAEARKAWGLSAQPVAAGLGQRRPLSPCTRCPPQLASRLNRDASSEQNRGPELFPNADRKFTLQSRPLLLLSFCSEIFESFYFFPS